MDDSGIADIQTVKLTVYLPENLEMAVRIAAAKQRKSLSAIATEAFSHFFSPNEDQK